MEFKKDDLVSWTYTHYLNGKSTTQITKEGIFIRPIKHGNKYHGPKLALVQFKWNDNRSRVPIGQLELIRGSNHGQ